MKVFKKINTFSTNTITVSNIFVQTAFEYMYYKYFCLITAKNKQHLTLRLMMKKKTQWECYPNLQEDAIIFPNEKGRFYSLENKTGSYGATAVWSIGSVVTV